MTTAMSSNSSASVPCSRRRRRRRGSLALAAAAVAACGCLLVPGAHAQAQAAPIAIPLDLGVSPPDGTSPGKAPGRPAVGREGTYSFDTKVRTLEILKTLRAGKLPLEVLDEALPGGQGEVGFNLAMRGWDGRPYNCAPVLDPRPNMTFSMDDATALVPARKDETVDQKLSVLKNTCAVLGMDYWSYEWCYRKEIRQFHLVAAEKEGQEPVRDPNWSLGKYVRTAVTYNEPGKKESGIFSAADYFEGGQVCHEIDDKGRQSAVEFYCCTSERLPARVKEAIKHMKPVPFAVAQLVSIKETSVCNYTLTVCTPLLCDSAGADSLIPLTGAAANSRALRLLEPLSSFCLTRHEGYWSYEFCYKKGIRQYHTVAMRDAKGRTVSKIDSEYVIGREHAVPEDFREEDHITVSQDDADPTVFELEYTGGTECDLTGELRATTVQFVCGEGGADQFISIKEDRSCHYKAVIATPRLCRHPAFHKQLPTGRTIRCEPAGVEGGRKR